MKFSVGHSFQIFFKLHFYLLTPHQTHQLSQQHFTPPGVTISREKHHKICHLSGKSVAKEQNFLCFLVASKVPHPSILSLYHSQQKLRPFQKNTVPSTLTNYCRKGYLSHHVTQVIINECRVSEKGEKNRKKCPFKLNNSTHIKTFPRYRFFILITSIFGVGRELNEMRNEKNCSLPDR